MYVCLPTPVKLLLLPLWLLTLELPPRATLLPLFVSGGRVAAVAEDDVDGDGGSWRALFEEGRHVADTPAAPGLRLRLEPDDILAAVAVVRAADV